MSNVQFEENNFDAASVRFREPKPSFLVRLILKSKMAKNADDAQQVLLIVAICIFIIAGVLFSLSFKSLPGRGTNGPVKAVPGFPA